MVRHHHRINGFWIDLVAWGLGLGIVIPALWFGAVRPEPQIVWAAFAAILFLIAALTRVLPRAPIPGMVVGFVAIAVWALIQCLPLGERVVLALQGPAGDRAAEGFRVAGVDSPWWSLSLDPGETCFQIVRSLVYGTIFLLSWAVSMRGRGRVILHSVAFLGVVEVLIGIFHALTAPEGGLSLFYPGALARRPGFHTTLLNDNHAASLFALSAFVCAALASEQRGVRTRAAFIVMATALGLAVFATLSRGGAAALTTVAILMGGGYLIRKRSRRGVWLRPLSWVILFVVTVVNAFIWLTLFEHVLVQYGHTSLEPSAFVGKVKVWEAAWGLITDHPWFGVGPGAFPTAVAAYAGLPQYTVDRAENAVLQAFADFGIPFGVGIVVFMVTVVARRLLRSRDWPAGWLVGGGLAAVALQNLADFGLEVAGLAVLVTACAGYLFGHPSGGHEGTRFVPRPTSRWRFVAPALALIGVVVFGVWALDQGRMRSHARLGAVVQDLRAGLPVTRDRVEPIFLSEVRRHPLDAHLFSLGAQAASLQGLDERALALAEHALVLAPDSLAPSLLRLRLLSRMERHPEAITVMRRLLGAYPRLRKDLFREMHSLRWSESHLLAVFDEDRDGLEAYLDFLKRSGDIAGYERMLRGMLERKQDDPVALERLGELYAAVRRPAMASDMAWRLIATHPDRHAGYFLAGRVAFAEGRLLEALTLFREAARRTAEPTEAHLWILACLARLKDWEAFDSLAREVEKNLATRRDLHGRFARILADGEHRRGRTRDALRILERAWNRNPQDVDTVKMIARLLNSEGRSREALTWYRRALRLKPTDEVLRREMREVENREQRDDDGVQPQPGEDG